MPESTELRVIVGDRGLNKSYTQIGDHVMIGTASGEIIKIEQKPTWTFITIRTAPHDKQGRSATGHRQQVHVTAGNLRRKVPTGSEINVTREVETFQERRQRRLKEHLKFVVDTAARSRRVVVNGMNKIRSEMETEWKAERVPLSLPRALDLAEAQGEWWWWLVVQKRMDNIISNTKCSAEEAAVRAMASTVEQATMHLTNAANTRVSSRSTSVGHNLQEDCLSRGAAVFLDDQRWSPISNYQPYIEWYDAEAEEN